MTSTSVAMGVPRRASIRRTLIAAPLLAVSVIAITIAAGPEAGRPGLLAAALVAAAAGISVTSVGVFGGILVPGLLLLGIEPRVAAPLSLLLQVIVIPIGATSHALVGHVQRSIAVPLVVGGVIGSVAGALLASSVPGPVVSLAVSLVIIGIGLVVLANLRWGQVAGYVDHEEIQPARIGSIGVVAGFASGISGAGWGPIGVKLLILSRIDPRHAIGSSLVGRITMAVAAIATYALSAAARGGFAFDPRLLVVLLAASTATMVPGTLLIARLGRGRATAGVAILSIALALPTLLAGLR